MSFNRDLLPDPQTYFSDTEGLKLTGPRNAKWKTTECRFHGGSDSLRINTTTGAWVCMACGAKGGDVLAYAMQFGGLDFTEAARALGAWVDDGKPEPMRKPTALPPRQALQVLTVEANLVAVAAANLARGVALSDPDRRRLILAAQRVDLIAKDFQ